MYNELQQKVNKVFLEEFFKTERPCLFYFCVDVARIFNKACVIIVLRLRTVNLLQGATLKGHLSCRLENQSSSSKTGICFQKWESVLKNMCLFYKIGVWLYSYKYLPTINFKLLLLLLLLLLSLSVWKQEISFWSLEFENWNLFLKITVCFQKSGLV